MTSDIDLGEDDGYVAVRAAGGASVTLDLFSVHNRVCDYHRANKDKPEQEYADGLVEFIESLGLPKCSHRMATRFIGSIRRRVDEVKKKDVGSP